MGAECELAGEARRMKKIGNRPRREAGFAMLFVFLMAAIAALMLYKELPRIALDVQRQREQLLVMRGEQYKRAIQMFVIDNKRWPTKIEELESLNNRRYLRKRYIDPITGKDEWRMIHIQNGMLTDSVVNKPPNATDPKNGDSFAWGGSSIGGESGMGQAPQGGALAGVNLANRKRATDGMPLGAAGSAPDGTGVPPGAGGGDGTQPQGAPGVPGYPGVPQQPGVQQPGVANGQSPWAAGGVLPPGVPGAPGMPGVPPVQTGQFPGQVPQYPAQPGQYPVPNQPYPNQPYPNQPYPNQYPGQPGQSPVQQPFMPGQPVNSQFGGVSPQPYPTAPGANGTPPGFPQPGSAVDPQTQGANQAQQMIQQILTTPRPGGMPTPNGQPLSVGQGIAGVASTADAEGILVYNNRTNYKEWEFIFDPNKYRKPPNPLGSSIGTPASQLGSMGGNQIGTPVTSMPGAGTGGPGFGGTPGGPGFGAAPGGPGFGAPPGGPGFGTPPTGPRQ